jgi:hypothetical protein
LCRKFVDRWYRHPVRLGSHDRNIPLFFQHLGTTREHVQAMVKQLCEYDPKKIKAPSIQNWRPEGDLPPR